MPTENDPEDLPVDLGDGKTELGVSLPEGVRVDDLTERVNEYLDEGMDKREAILKAVEDAIAAVESVEDASEDLEEWR